MGFENDSGYTITNLRSLTQQHSSSVAQVPFSLNNRTPGVLRGKDKPGSPFFGKEMPALPPDPFWGDAGSFFEDFETNNNTDWEGIETITEPFDFSSPDSSFSEDFEVPPWLA